MKLTSRDFLLQTFALGLGLILGFLFPVAINNMFPVLGITAGIGYFFVARRTFNKQKQLTDSRAYIIVTMLFKFIVGGAITSSILLFIDMM